MSLSAMKWVFDHSKTRGSARVLMLVIADMSNDDGECWPGKARLASKRSDLSPTTHNRPPGRFSLPRVGLRGVRRGESRGESRY